MMTIYVPEQWELDFWLPKPTTQLSELAQKLRNNYTSRDRLAMTGGSAGGMLMGAVVNLAPELFAGVIAGVPFVDVLHTMLRDDLPLTPPEWLEWGNPLADAAVYDRIASYSPYDNVRAQNYPPILSIAGVTDPRVTYWEPLKWVAKLRAAMTGGGPILLHTHMGAGHGGVDPGAGPRQQPVDQKAGTRGRTEEARVLGERPPKAAPPLSLLARVRCGWRCLVTTFERALL